MAPLGESRYLDLGIGHFLEFDLKGVQKRVWKVSKNSKNWVICRVLLYLRFAHLVFFLRSAEVLVETLFVLSRAKSG